MSPGKLGSVCAALLAASAQAGAQQTFANPPLLRTAE